MISSSLPSVRRLADLAQLELSEKEMQSLEGEFKGILEFVDRVSTLTVSERPLTTTISGVSHVLRNDVVVPSLVVEHLLALVPDRRERFIRVPRIL